MAILISSIIGIKLFLAIETRQNHFISYLKRIKKKFFWRKFRHFPFETCTCEQKACSRIAFASPLFFL